MRYLFDEQWFKEKQGVLLWLLNAPLIKIWFRYCLRIVRNIDCSLKDKIVEITPNSFTVDAGLQYFNKSALLKTAWENPNESRKIRRLAKKEFVKIKTKRKNDEKILLSALRECFYGKNKFSKELYEKFLSFWKICHLWDSLIAEKFIPNWDLGFNILTAYPQAGHGGGNVTCDGAIRGYNATYATAHSTPNDAYATNNIEEIARNAKSGGLYFIYRGGFMFYTGSLTIDATISTETPPIFSIYGTNWSAWNEADNVNIYSFSPANNNDIVTGDYGSFGTTPFCDTAIAFSAWVLEGWNAFIMNDSGIAAISKTNVTSCGTRSDKDVASTTPTLNNEIDAATSDDADSSHWPKLVITYTLPSVSANIFMGCNA